MHTFSVEWYLLVLEVAMKYMNFRNACAYASVCNLLEDVGIDVEDYELAIQGDLHHLIDFDKSKGQYKAGPMLQSEGHFNRALAKYGYRSINTKLTRDQVANHLNEANTRMFLGLKLTEGMKHAVIYEGIIDGQFIFTNNRRNDEDNHDIRLSETELLTCLDKEVYIGSITPTVVDYDQERKGLLNELNESIATLKKFSHDLKTIWHEIYNSETIQNVMASHLRALFLDYEAVIRWQDKEFADEILALRTTFLKLIKSEGDFRLADMCRWQVMNQVIDKITNKSLVRMERLKNESEGGLV